MAMPPPTASQLAQQQKYDAAWLRMGHVWRTYVHLVNEEKTPAAGVKLRDPSETVMFPGPQNLNDFFGGHMVVIADDVLLNEQERDARIMVYSGWKSSILALGEHNNPLWIFQHIDPSLVRQVFDELAWSPKISEPFTRDLYFVDPRQIPEHRLTVFTIPAKVPIDLDDWPAWATELVNVEVAREADCPWIFPQHPACKTPEFAGSHPAYALELD